MTRPLLHSLLLAACVVGARADNVLLVVLDDVGVDRVRAYGVHPSPAPTPTLDGLASEGVLFETCWATPFCSPTRATILTGRLPFRTGLGNVVTSKVGETGLSLDEWILPEVLSAGSGGVIKTAAIGKWHLGGQADPAWHAEASGFELYSGAPTNLGPPGAEEVWSNFYKLVHAGSVHVKQYATTDEIDDTLRAIEAFGDDPWFVHLALHAAHLPYHAPPDHLHDRELSGDPADSPAAHHAAAVQALDSELGRLLDRMDPAIRERTTVIVVADNGTQGPATTPPFIPTHGKGTLFEGGLRVPLIIAGHGVQPSAWGRRCAALVQTTDLFTTVAELLSVDARSVIPPEIELDGESLVPYLADPDLASLRPVTFTEHFKPNHADGSNLVEHRIALRGPRYKLVRNELNGVLRLYDLIEDPFEERELLSAKGGLTSEQRRALDELTRWAEAIRN